MTTSRHIVRHVVLDNEAASALLSQVRRDARRKAVIVAIMAANGRRVVPTSVRAEAGWDRSAPSAADANRLVHSDDPLDPPAANRVVQLRRAVVGTSIADASVAVAAERLEGADVVEVLTSDPGDIAALVAHIRSDVHIARL